MKTAVRCVYIFYLKNAGSLHDDFWCLFLNIWVIFAMLLISGSHWVLPGIYTPAFEICSCISQDHNQPRKFENTAIVFSVTTLFSYAIASIQINIFKHKNKSTTAHVNPNQSLHRKFPNKLIVELSLTIGSGLLIMATSSFVYIIDSTRATMNYHLMEYFYLLMMPITFNMVSVLFYAKNATARKIIFRELIDSLMK